MTGRPPYHAPNQSILGGVSFTPPSSTVAQQPTRAPQGTTQSQPLNPLSSSLDDRNGSESEPGVPIDPSSGIHGGNNLSLTGHAGARSLRAGSSRNPIPTYQPQPIDTTESSNCQMVLPPPQEHLLSMVSGIQNNPIPGPTHQYTTSDTSSGTPFVPLDVHAGGSQQHQQTTPRNSSSSSDPSFRSLNWSTPSTLYRRTDPMPLVNACIEEYNLVEEDQDMLTNFAQMENINDKLNMTFAFLLKQQRSGEGHQGTKLVTKFDLDTKTTDLLNMHVKTVMLQPDLRVYSGPPFIKACIERLKRTNIYDSIFTPQIRASMPDSIKAVQSRVRMAARYQRDNLSAAFRASVEEKWSIKNLSEELLGENVGIAEKYRISLLRAVIEFYYRYHPVQQQKPARIPPQYQPFVNPSEKEEETVAAQIDSFEKLVHFKICRPKTHGPFEAVNIVLDWIRQQAMKPDIETQAHCIKEYEKKWFWERDKLTYPRQENESANPHLPGVHGRKRKRNTGVVPGKSGFSALFGANRHSKGHNSPLNTDYFVPQTSTASSSSSQILPNSNLNPLSSESTPNINLILSANGIAVSEWEQPGAGEEGEGEDEGWGDGDGGHENDNYNDGDGEGEDWES